MNIKLYCDNHDNKEKCCNQSELYLKKNPHITTPNSGGTLLRCDVVGSACMEK